MSINTQLKAITKGYADDFKAISERSREERLKDLAPGSSIPASGKLYGDKAKNDFKVKADTYRARANEVIDKEPKSRNDKMTAAPSTEAVNTIQLLKMRNNLTEADINPLMKRYGDNTQVYDTLRDIAAQHGIHGYHLEENPLRVKANKLSDLKNSINNNLRVERAERGYASDGFISFLNATIDDALPEE